MIKATIFSRDRAIQLHALLDSLFTNANFFDEVEVIYKTKFYESYELLKDEFPKVTWTAEHIFKDDFMKSIKKGLNCLLVDDDIIFRPVDVAVIIEAMRECDIYSIRLGDNIKDRKHFDVKSSVDGNFFKADTLKLMQGERFSNPNELEMRLKKHTDGLTMCWSHESHTIGIPNNRVSVNSGCAHMGGDVNELDNYFIDGYRIDWRSMDLEYHNVHKNEPYILKCS